MLRRTLIAVALVPLGVAPPALSRPPTTGHPPPAGSPFTTRAVNRAAARTWAARLLSELRLPATAVRVPGEPAGAGRALASPGFALTTPESVDDTTWWTIDAPPSKVVAFVRAHRPRELRLVDHSVGGEPGRVTDDFWSYAAPPGLMQLTAAVQAAPLGGGRTAIRLDGEATWIVPRPSWDRIGAAVRSVTYTARATIVGLDGARASHGRRSAPRTLGRLDARRLAAAIDRLQRGQPCVAYSCPFDPVQPRITLRFRGPGGRPLAVAVERPAGCPSVGLSVHGRRGPAPPRSRSPRAARRSRSPSAIAPTPSAPCAAFPGWRSSARAGTCSPAAGVGSTRARGATGEHRPTGHPVPGRPPRGERPGDRTLSLAPLAAPRTTRRFPETA